MLDTCYSKNKYELSVLEKGLLTAFVIFLSHVFCAFFLFLYAKVFQDIVMMNDKSLHSGLDIFTGVILGPLVEEWIFRGILWSKLKSYGEGFAILATTILFAIMHGQGLLLIFLLIGFFQVFWSASQEIYGMLLLFMLFIIWGFSCGKINCFPFQ